MEYIEHASFIEIYWSLLSLAHFMTFDIFRFLKSTQHSGDVDGFDVF